jgi:hypothetical protein
MKQALPRYLPASLLAWRAGDMILLAAIGGATALAALLLSHPELSVFHKLVDIGLWLRGVGAKPEVVTWPAWGYAWVVAVFRDFDLIVFLQACLGVFALAALARRLRLAMPGEAAIIAVLCVLAIPWHDMQVTLYPSGPAGSLVLLAFLSLDAALSKNDLKRAIFAGFLVGLAQNLRTEFLLMPAFVGVCMLALRRWRVVESFPMKPLWVFILSALVLQLPWAMFYQSETGRYSLTESNLGHVMYVSLGSSPSNPWKIIGDDQGAMRAVREAGYPFSSLSEQGNQYLRRLVREKVKQHPYGVVQRTFQQLLNTALAPFNWGEPKLDKAGALDIDVLRQELKAHLGVGINVAKLNNFRSQDLYPKANADNAAKLALLYQVLAVGSGSVVFFLGVLGVVLALTRAKSARLPLLLWLLAGAASYKILQDVLLAYQVNYLNNVYPMFLPFVAISLTAMGGRLRGRKPVPPGRA